MPKGAELGHDEEEEIYSQVLASERNEKYGFKCGVGPVPKSSSFETSRAAPQQNIVQHLQNEISEVKADARRCNELIERLLQHLNLPAKHPGSFSWRRDD